MADDKYRLRVGDKISLQILEDRDAPKRLAIADRRGIQHHVIVLCRCLFEEPFVAADDVTSLAPLIDGVVFIIRAEHTSARVA